MNYSFRRGDICILNDEEPKQNTYITRGNRPVIVVSSDQRNLNSKTCLIVPLTGSLHRGLYPGQFDILLNGRRSRVLCDQMRVVDQSALNVPHAHISRDVEATLENALLEVLGIREMAGVSLA